MYNESTVYRTQKFGNSTLENIGSSERDAKDRNSPANARCEDTS
jgi:hypothetical protein